MSDGIFDERVAPWYDAASAEMCTDSVLGPTVDLLAELAGKRQVLEFAIGTGRVALPLSERGLEVYGIELSRPMVQQMGAKSGAERVQVTIGDMTSTRVEGTFGLVYLVYNTIGNLLTQNAQVACFQNAAAHLEPGGHFLVEVTVPALRRLPPGQTIVPFEASATHLGFDAYDVANQLLTSHHYWISGSRVTTFDTPQRYASPAEYDLMARIAGMTLQHRWSGWNREPFTGESTSHVSVWTKQT